MTEAKKHPAPNERTWRCTYRVQLHAGFTFDDAAATVDYLAELGITHLYCSPYLQAVPGSTHGYDVVDHLHLNDDLGGEAAHHRLVTALGSAGLGQLLDIVPNHMAIAGRANRWWWDVLENGPASLYAPYFDIDWEHQEAKLSGKVLVPVLGDHYGRVLEAGELTVERTGGSFVVRYHDHELPVSPRTVDELLADAARDLALAMAGRADRVERADEGEGVTPHEELASIATALGRLPTSLSTDRGSLIERDRDKQVLAARLDQLCIEHPDLALSIDAAVERLSRDIDALDAFLERQNHRLAYWKVAGRELGYRRFFDITDLVALRVENPEVFDETHSLVLDMVWRGDVDGLRIDHPDGLRDPEGYLVRLADAAGSAKIVVEKILGPGEALPESWPVAGTTGYDFLNRVGRLFVDPAGELPLTEFYRRFTGELLEPSEVAYDSKHLVMRDVLASDVERLTAVLVDVCESTRHFRDFTRWELRETVVETIAAFDVYRTYVRPGVDPSAGDVARITTASGEASKRRPDLDVRLFELLADILLLRRDGVHEREVSARFQQVSAAVMAKGAEDTAMYRFQRLAPLNEVGAEVGAFGLDVPDFHRVCAHAAERWPGAMLATSTHDTKRGEDVRARLGLLSEIPADWSVAVQRWSALAQRYRRSDLPDRNTEYLLYQTLVGTWPIEVDRVHRYMEKAVREAKVYTSWTDPQSAYEEALRSFVDGVMADDELVRDIGAFAERIVGPGRVVSLAQTLLKLTCPGVPDVYQGTELWDLSLVDPDNRRPVDYGERRRLLHETAGARPEEIWADAASGRPKLHLIHRALEVRRNLAPALDGAASYAPLMSRGSQAGHIVAFVRGEIVAVVVPRLVIGLEGAGGWDDTTVELPDGDWKNELTGDDLSVGRGTAAFAASLFERFPVALLTRR